MNLHGIIILAAGASTRLGQPKQLLQYEGKSLIQRITYIALDVIISPIVVVLGAHSDLIRSQISDLPVKIVYNRYWTNGIASSIRTGLMAALNLSQDLDTALFLVCDQPYVSPNLLNEMLGTWSGTKMPIIACSYNNTLGTPVLFSKKYFNELLRLKGIEGARKVVQQHPQEVLNIPFPMGNVDIDTLQDYSSLQS